MNGTALSSEQIQRANEQKLLSRRYFLVSLSDKTLGKDEEFHCFKCGYVVTSTYNDPKSTTEVKVDPADIAGLKAMGILCRKDNIMYIFV